MWLEECQKLVVSVQCKANDYLQPANANPGAIAPSDTKASEDESVKENPSADRHRYGKATVRRESHSAI